MENLLDKLQQERELTQNKLVLVEDDDFTARLQKLKEIYEEMELVAASSYVNLNVTEAQENAEETLNPNPNVLTSDFYTQYLLILFISHEMNDARFLWKRIDSKTKKTSQVLRNVWEIGKMLWQRNFAGAYQVMDKNSWSNDSSPLVALLRKVTREETTRLVSSAYKSISFTDAAQALGFVSNPQELLQYCTQLNWTISQADQMIHPSPIKQNPSRHTNLQQLQQLSQYVLHLEQATIHKLQ